VLLPNEDGDDFELAMLIEPNKRQRGARQLTAPVNSLCHRVPAAEVQGLRIAPWGVSDYLAELEKLATELDIDLAACARRYGTLTLRDSENGWRFHPALGFVAATG
jgi:CRISPR-associated endonuclease/helicase Cas3